MRIISDFHDYYDVGMQNGVDPQLPYRRFRKEESIHFPNAGWRSFGQKIVYYVNRGYFLFYVGFAGKVWPCMDTAFNTDEPSFCFDPFAIGESFFVEVGKKCGHWLCRRFHPLREKDIQTVANGVKDEIIECFEFKHKSELLDLFEQFKTAIFVYQLGSETIVINERLNQYGFQKVLPPMLAFQELEMYVGACLTKPTIEEPPIPDKIKAEIHGFDKYSFRKDKQKHG